MGGKSAITRLREQTWFALPEVLNGLESFACHEIGRKVIPADGIMRMFGRRGYVGTAFSRVTVTLVETLEGLGATVDGQSVAVLRQYRDMRQLSSWDCRKLSQVLYFEAPLRANCGPTVR